MSVLKKMYPKILITGASGFLGTNLSAYFFPIAQVIVHTHTTKSAFSCTESIHFDLACESEIKKAIAELDVDYVIHLAALSSPDECSRDKIRGYRINVEGTRHLLNYCNEKNIPVIYFSSDMVFDGKRGDYTEDDQPNPINFYTETKYVAEQLTLASHESNLICRLSLAYGKSLPELAGGFIDKVLHKLLNNQPVPLFDDQYRTPIFSQDIAKAVEKIIEKKMIGDTSCSSRIFHLAGNESVTPYSIGLALSFLYHVPESLCRPTPMDSLKDYVTRSRNCSLNNNRTNAELGFMPRSLCETLELDKTMRLQQTQYLNRTSLESAT